MNHYLVSFPSSSMQVSAEELPAVAAASRAVVQEARDAGVWVFGGGIDEGIDPVVVSGDGTVTPGSSAETAGMSGGFTVLRLETREEAEQWAARIAVGCGCDQELRVFMWDPLS